MAMIKPFQGVRPQLEYVKDIAALPYDVYSSEEAREVVADKPLSFLKIDRAETFFAGDVDLHSPQVYEKARETLYDMMGRGYFIQEDEPCLYIYQLTMDQRTQTGLVACTSIDEYLNNTIKKHELTRSDKEMDRIQHVDTCDANTGPIFLTYQAEVKINKIIEDWKTGHQTVYDLITEDNIGHVVWRIEDPVVMAQLVSAFKGVQSLYIADGHHRAASAVKVGQKRREAFPSYSGHEEFNTFLSVIFPHDQLKIMDYNRVIKDLNGLTPQVFIEEVKNNFNLLKTSHTAIKPTEKGTFGMFLEGEWYLLGVKEGTYSETDPVLSLDVSILQLNLLAPILGIGDPRTDKRIDFVGGIRGLGELEKRVNEDMMVAFAMFPTSLEELMKIADADELMPPKSTWFEPKLRSGLFIHLLK